MLLRNKDETQRKGIKHQKFKIKVIIDYNVYTFLIFLIQF